MKNRFLSMRIGAVLFVLSAAAENYPYRSDVLWVTVPDHADWLYCKNAVSGESSMRMIKMYFFMAYVHWYYSLSLSGEKRTGSLYCS